MRPEREPGRWDLAEYQRARRALYRKRIAYCEHPDCLAPDVPIDYTGPRFVIGDDGRRILNPWAFEADHVTSRAEGGDHTLRACHARCNRTAGARLGAQRRWGSGVRSARPRPWHTRRW